MTLKTKVTELTNKQKTVYDFMKALIKRKPLDYLAVWEELNYMALNGYDVYRMVETYELPKVMTSNESATQARHSISKTVSHAFESLTEVQRVEVLHLAIRYILMNGLLDGDSGTSQ